MPKFTSRYPNYLLVIRPPWREVVNGQIVVHPGKTVQFQPGGITTQGEYHTDDPEEIEFLRKHPRYGVHIVEAGVDMKSAGAAIAVKEDEGDLSDDEIAAAIKRFEAELARRRQGAETTAESGAAVPSAADVEPDGDGFFACPIDGCSKRFGSRASLNGHLLSHRKSA